MVSVLEWQPKPVEKFSMLEEQRTEVLKRLGLRSVLRRTFGAHSWKILQQSPKSKNFWKLFPRDRLRGCFQGRKVCGKSIIVQARPNSLSNYQSGLHGQQRVGNAVARNRASVGCEQLWQKLWLLWDFWNRLRLIGRAQTTCNTKFEELKTN